MALLNVVCNFHNKENRPLDHNSTCLFKVGSSTDGSINPNIRSVGEPDGYQYVDVPLNIGDRFDATTDTLVFEYKHTNSAEPDRFSFSIAHTDAHPQPVIKLYTGVAPLDYAPWFYLQLDKGSVLGNKEYKPGGLFSKPEISYYKFEYSSKIRMASRSSSPFTALAIHQSYNPL